MPSFSTRPLMWLVLTHKLEKKKKFYGLRGGKAQFLLSKRSEKNAPCDQCNLF
jgi:hypothetical protein